MDDINPKYIKKLILEELADMRLQTYQELLEQTRSCDGNLGIKGKEESFVVPWVEDKLKRGIIFVAKDFGASKIANSCLSPVNGTTVNELRDRFLAKLACMS